ncbi:glycosyltransferase [Candidatus Roizmanbacteria bacterium]|nr:glycosyltransferase [Candidatus Roizmanbacteria bacterium]
MISVVIPVYKKTDQFLKSLSNNFVFFKDCQVIVVNDDPTASLVSTLASFRPLTLLENRTNLGFAGAANAGVAKATNPYVVLLNSDVFLTDGSFQKALRLFKKKATLFAVAFAQKEKDGRLVGKNRVFWARGLMHHEQAPNILPGPTAWAEGGAMMFDRIKFQKLGGFDSLFSPFYWEDIDLSYRAWKAKYEVLFEPAITVGHHHETTIGSLFSREEIKTISFRNGFLFIRKNITSPRLLTAYYFYLLPNLLYYGLLKRETAFIRGFFAAIKKNNFIRRAAHTGKADEEILRMF